MMNNEYLEAWLEKAASVPHQAEQLFSDLTIEELNDKPQPNQWSIGELIDHLIVTNSLYVQKYQKIIDGQHKNPLSSRINYITEVLGKSILRSVDPDNPKKLKTVRKFEPNKKIFEMKILSKFISQHEELVNLIKKSDLVNHQTTFISSPASPIIVYSLEYATKIIISHELRHLSQAKQLLKPKLIE